MDLDYECPSWLLEEETVCGSALLASDITDKIYKCESCNPEVICDILIVKLSEEIERLGKVEPQIIHLTAGGLPDPQERPTTQVDLVYLEKTAKFYPILKTLYIAHHKGLKMS